MQLSAGVVSNFVDRVMYRYDRDTTRVYGFEGGELAKKAQTLGNPEAFFGSANIGKGPTVPFPLLKIYLGFFGGLYRVTRAGDWLPRATLYTFHPNQAPQSASYDTRLLSAAEIISAARVLNFIPWPVRLLFLQLFCPSASTSLLRHLVLKEGTFNRVASAVTVYCTTGKVMGN